MPTEKQYEVLLRAARLYRLWAHKTGDYPHDQSGCEAHSDLIEAIEDIDGKLVVHPDLY